MKSQQELNCTDIPSQHLMTAMMTMAVLRQLKLVMKVCHQKSKEVEKWHSWISQRFYIMVEKKDDKNITVDFYQDNTVTVLEKINILIYK